MYVYWIDSNCLFYPFRYVVYHWLFRLSPLFVRDWLIERFVNMPKYNNWSYFVVVTFWNTFGILYCDKIRPIGCWLPPNLAGLFSFFVVLFFLMLFSARDQHTFFTNICITEIIGWMTIMLKAQTEWIIQQWIIYVIIELKLTTKIDFFVCSWFFLK